MEHVRQQAAASGSNASGEERSESWSSWAPMIAQATASICRLSAERTPIPCNCLSGNARCRKLLCSRMTTKATASCRTIRELGTRPASTSTARHTRTATNRSGRRSRAAATGRSTTSWRNTGKRHVDDFAGRYNARPMNTLDQMGAIVQGMDQKRTRYKVLIR